MKRNDLITKLIAEGFSVETLASFTDKQLIMLSKKMINEQVTLGASTPTSPAAQIVNVKGGTPAEKALKAQGKSFITYEEEMAEEENAEVKKEKLILSGKKKEVKETAKVPVITPGKKPAKKGHSVTSKNEIMEMIHAKLNEQKNVKK